VTVRGNVVACDRCGRQIGMPMEAQSGGKQSLDALVLEWAAGEEGWRHTDQGDFCPDHVLEE
jgi:hypothetical protein